MVNFWFDSENGSRIIITFRSSNSHSGIITSSLSLLKFSIVFPIKFLWKPAEKNFFVMLFASKLAILLALFNSPLWHYVYIWQEFLKTDVLEDFTAYCKLLFLFHVEWFWFGIQEFFWVTFVYVSHPCRMISVSKNFVGFFLRDL